MSKHTPGPWAARALVDHIEIVPVNDLGIQPTLARIEKWAREGVNESNANARLIAAAPALLEALKRMASIIDKMGDMPDGFIHPSPWQTLKCEEALTQARAAIAKAEEA